MDMDDFIAKLKEAKPSTKYTTFIGVKVVCNHEHTKWLIYKKDECKCCKRTSINALHVEFSKPHQMTIFEVDMLYLVYVQGKKPRDYGGFHKCDAGKKFIYNIKEIRQL